MDVFDGGAGCNRKVLGWVELGSAGCNGFLDGSVIWFWDFGAYGSATMIVIWRRRFD